jgi:hypothetical protein
MADPFTTTILRLEQMGFFKFLLPFIFTSAVFYGLLRKSQIFGPPEKNVVVNGVVALSAAFMILAVPITQGIDPQKLWAAYFVQSASAFLVAMVGIMIAGMVFPPDLPGYLGKTFGAGKWSIVLVGGLIVGLVILFTSGLSGVFFPGGAAPSWLSEDTLMSIAVVVVLAIVVVVIMYFVGAGEKKSGS